MAELAVSTSANSTAVAAAAAARASSSSSPQDQSQERPPARSSPARSRLSLRRQQTQDRINDILETGRQRAESLGDPQSPRMQPLLRQETPAGRSIPEHGDAFDDEHDHGVVMRQPERRNSPNYRTMMGSNSTVRRKSSNQQPEGQARGSDGNANHRTNSSTRRGKEPEGRWRKALGYFQSVELENKGSVARDHLALERTFLAWLRTSLAFASIGIAITQLFRLNTSLSNEAGVDNTLKSLGKPLGATFLAVSILILFLGYNRYLQAQHWVMKGKFPASRGTIMVVSFVAFAVMAASLVVVVVVHPGEVP